MSEDLTKKLPQTADEKLTLVLSTVQALAVRVDRLEQFVQARLHDTRPIWHRTLADIGQLQQNFQRLEDCFRTSMHELNTSVRDLVRRFSVITDTQVTIQADYRDVYDRVRTLEAHCNPPNSQT